jgi:hypothetical protein
MRGAELDRDFVPDGEDFSFQLNIHNYAFEGGLLCLRN